MGLGSLDSIPPPARSPSLRRNSHTKLMLSAGKSPGGPKGSTPLKPQDSQARPGTSPPAVLSRLGSPASSRKGRGLGLIRKTTQANPTAPQALSPARSPGRCRRCCVEPGSPWHHTWASWTGGGCPRAWSPALQGCGRLPAQTQNSTAPSLVCRRSEPRLCKPTAASPQLCRGDLLPLPPASSSSLSSGPSRPLPGLTLNASSALGSPTLTS